MRKWLLLAHLCPGLLLLAFGVLSMHSAAALDIETLVMPDKVIAGHAKFEADCSSCHAAFKRERQNSLCTDCHQEVGADQSRGRGFHGLHEQARSANCASCHTEHKGRDASIVILDTSSFDHDLSDFALLDKHTEAACDDCHRPDALYREAPLQCNACHREDDVHKGGLGEECASCHAPKGWEFIDFDHEAETSFALLGGHAGTTCIACHAEQKFVDTDPQCVACHRDDDEHKGKRGDDCGSCHGVENWQESFFDHRRKTDFPLLGAHASTSCEQCHVGSTVAVQLESTCIACHREDDKHKGLLGEDCVECHGEVSWTESKFDHATFSEFALLGGHAAIECESCHATPVHESSPGTACIDCHREDDPHAGQQGESCGDCHNETDWAQDVRFDHDFSSFPLIGGHREAECTACHESSQFQDASVACIDCHRDKDVHKGGLGTDCGSCHNPVDWTRWRFDHFLSSGFTLDGAHTDLVCADCHRSAPKPGQTTPSRCVDCHRKDDVHNGQFGKDCARCHSTSTFEGAEER